MTVIHETDLPLNNAFPTPAFYLDAYHSKFHLNVSFSLVNCNLGMGDIKLNSLSPPYATMFNRNYNLKSHWMSWK